MAGAATPKVISRFGDTAANVGILAIFETHGQDLPIVVKTGAASVTAGFWRILIMPIDTVKTTLQVDGKEAMSILRSKLNTGPNVLYHGSLAACGATIVGHFPWFYTFNTLQAYIPQQEKPLRKLGRNALIGFVSSVVSDSISNSLRVIKTTRQTFPKTISYVDTVKHVVAQDGVMGLLGRGLKTR